MKQHVSIAIISILLCASGEAQTQTERDRLQLQTDRDKEGRYLNAYFNRGLSAAEAASIARQGSIQNQDAQRASAKAAADGITAMQRQKEIQAEAGQYSANMRYQAFLDRLTAEVPSPNTISNTLREIGPIEVNSETNRRSGTINYRVACQATNREAIFSLLKRVPNRTSISQGTNSVMFAIRLPTAQ